MTNREIEKNYGKIIFVWRINDFEKYQKSFMWYVLAIIAGLGLLVYAVFTANFLFAVIILMFAVIVLIQELREPNEITCCITENGVIIGERVYKYKEFENFWIIYEPPHLKNLYLEFKGIKPRLSIPLKKQNPNDVRKFLCKYVVEDLEKEEEPLSEFIGRVLKI